AATHPSRAPLVDVAEEIADRQHSDSLACGRNNRTEAISQEEGTEVQQEIIESIFELARTLQLCGCSELRHPINHPGQLAKTSLGSNCCLFENQFAQSRGKSQTRSMTPTAEAAEKRSSASAVKLTFYNATTKTNWRMRCEHLLEYLEAYWRATHPPSMLSKLNDFLAMSGQVHSWRSNQHHQHMLHHQHHQHHQQQQGGSATSKWAASSAAELPRRRQGRRAVERRSRGLPERPAAAGGPGGQQHPQQQRS
uniref:HA domain-containing protein n=1 Tax=Macrostomum lignano TaxID=282301 RepID=A0A1I8FHF4_9PLAT